MKNFLFIVLSLLIVFSFAGCDSNTVTSDDNISNNTTSTSSKYNVDYSNSELFEKALNAGTTVKGAIVRFDVVEYKPYSAIGINCWSGEHLNFISEEELDVEKGDIIVGRITEEPINAIGSWRIKYEVIEINPSDNKNVLENNQNDVTTQKTTVVSNNETITTTELQKTNSVFYSTNDYETAKEGNTGVFAYVNEGTNYDIYYIIDFDEGYVYYFLDGEGNTFCDKLKIDSGDLNNYVSFTYHDGNMVWSERLHFKYKNVPTILIWNDADGYSYEYSPTDLEEALSVRDTKTIKSY